MTLVERPAPTLRAIVVQCHCGRAFRVPADRADPNREWCKCGRTIRVEYVAYDRMAAREDEPIARRYRVRVDLQVTREFRGSDDAE